MASVWDKFDKAIDTEGLQKDVAEAFTKWKRKLQGCSTW